MLKTKTQAKVSKLNLNPDKADDFLVTKFNYENVTATEIKELINLLLFSGKRNANEKRGITMNLFEFYKLAKDTLIKERLHQAANFWQSKMTRHQSLLESMT